MSNASVWCTSFFRKNQFISHLNGAKTFETIFISDYQAHWLLLQMLSYQKTFDSFPNTVNIMLNLEPQIQKIVLHLYKTIQYMFLSIVNGQN